MRFRRQWCQNFVSMHSPSRSTVTAPVRIRLLNILSASVHTSRDRVAVLRFTFEMGDPGHLGHVIRAVQNVDGVLDAERVTGGRRDS